MVANGDFGEALAAPNKLNEVTQADAEQRFRAGCSLLIATLKDYDSAVAVLAQLHSTE
jgi:hypothetical protein